MFANDLHIGRTLADITKEKCGIIKSRSIYGVLIGPGCPIDIAMEDVKARNANLALHTLADEYILPLTERLYPYSHQVDSTRTSTNYEIVQCQDIDKLNSDIARCAVKILAGKLILKRNGKDCVMI